MSTLAINEVTVEYPGVRALDNVTLRVETQQVHALMGENGAGKSTLLKVLAGVQAPLTGTLTIDGRQVVFRSAAEALAAGIAVIYQELNLVPKMSVAENLLLGQLPSRRGFIAQRQLRERARAMLADLGEDIDPDAPLESLSLGQRQMVEIGKALLRNARIIAFDEPTSALSVRETVNLQRIIRRLKADGCAILYVTHRMDEVFALCDAVTVLRDGAQVAHYGALADLTVDRLVRDMVGREIADVYGYRPRPIGEVLLEVEALEGPGLSAPLNLAVRRGELLGVFGLIGAGRSELMRMLCGAEPRAGGSIRFKGRPVCHAQPREAIRDGIALCPEDRKRDGIFPVASVSDNLNISARHRSARAGIWLDRRQEALLADRYIEQLRVRTPDRGTAVSSLSGGNQQKVILGRWLAEDVELLIMDEPTRGIDVGARTEIYGILYELTARGKGVIVVSSDLPEVLSISDRVAVMREGVLVGVVERAQATPELLLSMALPQ